MSIPILGETPAPSREWSLRFLDVSDKEQAIGISPSPEDPDELLRVAQVLVEYGSFLLREWMQRTEPDAP